jgi:phenylalanyl-tRNA synthetase alpha subunit
MCGALGIRDFIRNLEKHREKVQQSGALPEEERREILREAEMMVGMADHAIKSLESALNNRHLNLNEEHAVRFAQDVFAYLRDQEEDIKAKLR